jgi:hypothetical protein
MYLLFIQRMSKIGVLTYYMYRFYFIQPFLLAFLYWACVFFGDIERVVLDNPGSVRPQNYDVKVFTIHFVLTWQLSITTFCPYICSKRKPIWLPVAKITHQWHHWQQLLSLLELVVGIPFARQNFQRKKILFCLLFFLLYSPKSLYPLFKKYKIDVIFLSCHLSWNCREMTI